MTTRMQRTATIRAIDSAVKVGEEFTVLDMVNCTSHSASEVSGALRYMRGLGITKKSGRSRVCYQDGHTGMVAAWVKLIEVGDRPVGNVKYGTTAADLSALGNREDELRTDEELK